MWKATIAVVEEVVLPLRQHLQFAVYQFRDGQLAQVVVHEGPGGFPGGHPRPAHRRTRSSSRSLGL